MTTAAKCVLLFPIFWAYLVPLDVVVTRNITAKICEVWSEFKKKNRNRLDKLCRSCHENKKGGDLKHFWIPFIKLHETL
jgi:hypothetical protein